MSSPAEVIAQLLIDLNLATEGGEWPVYIAVFQDEPHKAICVYDTPARPDGRILRTGEQIEHPGIQIQVRGTDYPVAYEKATAIVLALDEVRKVSVVVSSEDVYIIHNVSRRGGLIPMGLNGDRQYFAINATLTLKQESE